MDLVIAADPRLRRFGDCEEELPTAAEPLLRSMGELDTGPSALSASAFDCINSAVADPRLLVDAGGVGSNISPSVPSIVDPRLLTSAELFAN